MAAGRPVTFAYRDEKLGDTEAVTVATAADAFRPTSTTVLLLKGGAAPARRQGAAGRPAAAS